MDIIFIICAAVVGVIFLAIYLVFVFHKKRILKKLADKYGKVSTRVYDERDFANIGQLFRLSPANEKEIVDDITWFDLQMPLVYRQINHSVSHIGDEYLHRHLRTQQYSELNRLEKHIQYFTEHPDERLNLQYAFYHINPVTRLEETRTYLSENKKTDINFVAHIKDANLFPKISLIPPVAICISMLLCLSSVFFISGENVIGILAFILAIMAIIFGTALYFESFIRKTQDYMPTIKTFCKSFDASAQIAKLDPDIFDKELKPLIPVLKKCSEKAKLMDMMIGICLMQNAALAIFGLISIFFGLYGFVYRWAVKTITKNTEEAMIAYESIGYIELCIGLGSYRKTLPYFCHPDFTENNQVAFHELYHPLLTNPVTNTKTINQKLIITGANASGKSTFIKTLAINAIIAQNINMCYAKEFHFRPAYIYTSMNLSDDITTGDSFYMAEIKRLRRFLDFLGNSSYKMYFVDEILKGTNTTERIAAASTILRRFADADCFFCLATHDTELTSILQHYYSNYHFEETTTDTEIQYDYKLYDGVTPGSNAIALLKVMQYDQSIVDGALKLVEHYRGENEWEVFTLHFHS